MTFGNTLRQLRKGLGWSQTELGEKLGVAQETIGAYERGIKKPEMDKIPALVKILGVSADEILGIKKIKPSENPRSIHKNRRISKVQELFDKLKPDEQRIVLKQIKSLAEK